MVTFCVGTAFINILLKERWKGGGEDEEEDLSNHCMTFKEMKNWKLKDETLGGILENSLWNRFWTVRQTE